MSRSRVILLAAIMLAMIAGRVLYGSWDAWREGTAARQAGNLPQAITHFERAIHYYAPGSPWVASSVEALRAIGEAAEREGNRELALSAFRTLRSSLYAVRSTYTPFAGMIPRCNEKIAELVAHDPAYRARFPELSPEGLKARVTSNLTRNEAPDVFWSLVVELGFFGWVGGTIGFILRVLHGTRETFSARRAIFWGGLVVAGYALWVVGLMKA